MSISLYFDGLCEPKNPGGVPTFGFVVRRNGKLLHEECGLAAEPWTAAATNNVAEYTGVVRGLQWLVEQKHAGEKTVIRGDSKLVISQLNGEWKVKAPGLIALFKRARELAGSFKDIEFEWVPREENREADALTNRAYAEFIGSSKREKRREDDSIRVTRGVSLELDVTAPAAAVYRHFIAAKWAGPGSRVEARKGGRFALARPAIAGTVEEAVENRFLSVRHADGSLSSIVLSPLADGTRVRCDVGGVREAATPLEKDWQIALLTLQSTLQEPS